MAGINVTFQFDHLLKQLESMELMSKQAFLFLLAVSTKQDLALDFGTEAFVYKSEVKLFDFFSPESSLKKLMKKTWSWLIFILKNMILKLINFLVSDTNNINHIEDLVT